MSRVDSQHRVSEVRVIPVPRQQLFDLVADPSQHPHIDGSGTVRAMPAGGPARLGPGVRFGMSMRMGLPYRTANRVVEFEEGRVIGWAHFSRAVWRWEFRDAAGGTEVTETFDWSASIAPAVMRRFAPGNLVAMQRSIARLAGLAEDPSSDVPTGSV
jgi:uncharacterized protein YndB with AHSA1/START domain